jgi:arylformamidase
MIVDYLEQEYTLSQLRPDVNYIPRWEALSKAFRERTKGQTDLPYGSGARERLDFFPTKSPKNAPTLLFVHGGYWQRGDKSVYSFLAEPFLSAGISFAAISYDFCPGSRISEIASQVASAVCWLEENIESLGANKDRMFISGHSAGGHLSGMMVTSARRTEGRTPFKGAMLLSGIFDLNPLMTTSHNQQLKIDEEEARLCSPAMRHSLLRDNLLVGCGVGESTEFNRQSNLLVETMRQDGANVAQYHAEGNHLDIIDELSKQDSGLFQAALKMIKP